MFVFSNFSRILQDRESCIEAALDTASLIASKSPVAVQGTKVNMVYSRDHSVADGLNHVVSENFDLCFVYHKSANLTCYHKYS